MGNSVRHRAAAPSRRSVLASLGGAVAAVAGVVAAGAETKGMVTIRGEVTHLQRIALPDDAVAIVELRPAGLAEGEPVTAEWRHAMKGAQVPVPFTMQVDRDRLSATTDPVLRAGIQVDGRMAWLSDPVPVGSTAGAIDVGTIIVRPFHAPPAFGLLGAADLAGSDWLVVELAGEAVADEAPVTLGFSEPDGFHGRACNSYGGTYTLDGGAIAFGDAAATLMACQEPMASREQSLFRAFEQARQASIDAGGQLVIADGGGAPLLLARRQDAQ